jgi:hypothetical protein
MNRIFNRFSQAVTCAQRARTIATSLAVLLVASACQSTPYDYSALVESNPKSILVLAPLDETLEVDATYGALSTLTRPLAEQGYYVFPVAMVDQVMRSNGLPDPADMHQVPLAKLKEIFEPDAVLYVTVSNWGTSYQVINSQTAVTLQARLIDARTGTTLWQGASTVAQNSGGSGLGGMLASALVSQVVSSASDPSRDLSAQAAHTLLRQTNRGLLPGPYDPEHASAIQDYKEAVAKQ